MCGLGFAKVLAGFLGRGPVNATYKGLAVAPIGEPVLSLLFGLSQYGFFYLPPGLAEINMGFCHECCLISMPLVEVVGVPAPFMGGCHGSFDMVPRVLLLPQSGL